MSWFNGTYLHHGQEITEQQHTNFEMSGSNEMFLPPEMSLPHGLVPSSNLFVLMEITEQHIHFETTPPNDEDSIEMVSSIAAAETPDFSTIYGTTQSREQEITEQQHTNFEAAQNQDNEMVNNPELTSLPAKKRKLRSKVWDEFTKTKEGEEEWASCNHCERRFDGSSKKGTTHLRNHLRSCPVKRLKTCESGAADKLADKIGDSLTITTSANIIKGKSKVDEELNQLDKTRMMIKNWVPLEYIKEDLLKVYEEEKEKLMRYFHELPCRFHLFIDYLDSYETMIHGSVHFINDNWELKKKVVCIGCIDDEVEDFYDELKCMVRDWNIGKDILSTVSPYSLRDEVIGSDLLPSAMSFYALPAFVNALRGWWLCEPQDVTILRKMWKLKEYVSSNAAANSKIISQPLATRTGYSKFKFVEWVVGLKEVFWELEHIDPIGFKPLNLTKEEWDLVTAIYELVKDVRDIANSLSVNCKYTTPNVCFPLICRLYKILLKWPKSDMAIAVRELFDNFWSNLNIILAIAVVLDPRFKMDIVEHWYVEIYPNESDIYTTKIRDEVNNIYREYAKAIESSQTSVMLDPMERPCTSSHQVDYIASSTQSELDRYLKDPKFSAIEDFDILAWWRSNSPVYPLLARMARDYLAIPIAVQDCLDSSFVNEVENIFYSEEIDDDFIKKALVYTKAWL